MILSEKIKILEQRISESQMDYFELQKKIEKMNQEIYRLAKIIFLYGHSEFVPVLIENKVIDFMYENCEFFKDKDIDISAYRLQLLMADYDIEGKTIEQARKLINE